MGHSQQKFQYQRLHKLGQLTYEAELSFIISKTGKYISGHKDLDYVLGYTACNEVSARVQKFKNIQWCFSKGHSSSIYETKLTME